MKWPNRIPLQYKMSAAAMIIGLMVLLTIDQIQNHELREFFLGKLTERLSVQAMEDRIRFDRYIKAHYQLAELIISQDSFSDYIERQTWRTTNAFKPKHYERPPAWLHGLSLMRGLAELRFAVLYDPRKQAREVYYRRGEIAPPSLLHLTELQFIKSHKQVFLTNIDGVPFLIASASRFSSKGKLQATLMLASPIDDTLLTAAVLSTAPGRLVALLSDKGESGVMVSNNLSELPSGTPFEAIKKNYIITGYEALDYGEAEMPVNFVSLISKTEAESLTGAILLTERKQRIATGVIFILTFTLIMLWIAHRINNLTQYVRDFSQRRLGIMPRDMPKGDQLHMLEERFKYLTKEIVDARDEIARAIKREAEEMTRLIVNNAFDAIITMDSGGVITTWNPLAEKVFGWSSHEIIGQRAADTIIPLSYRKAHEDGLKHFLSTGESQILNKTIETTGLHRKGYKFPIELAVASALSGDELIFIAIIRDITGRKKTEEHIRTSLREKEVLLKEIHHRVKNNMQIITSLLRLQAGKSADAREIEMLRESRNRIRSMALIHEKLYQTSDLAHINFKDYIHDLTRGLYRSYGADVDKISFNIEADDILLEVDTAIPCGLIVNEIVSNALKYAFPGNRRGTINVRLRRILESEIENEESQIPNPKSQILELTVSDNGIGIPGDFDFRNTGSLGLKLVTALSENQLNGKIEFEASEGTNFRIRFKGKSHEEELSG